MFCIIRCSYAANLYFDNRSSPILITLLEPCIREPETKKHGQNDANHDYSSVLSISSHADSQALSGDDDEEDNHLDTGRGRLKLDEDEEEEISIELTTLSSRLDKVKDKI